MNETKYTARRNLYGNTSLYRGSRNLTSGWLAGSFTRIAQNTLVERGHKTLRVVTSDNTTTDLAADSYEAWSAIFKAATDHYKFTVFAK